jgi:hypothetical protein
VTYKSYEELHCGTLIFLHPLISSLSLSNSQNLLRAPAGVQQGVDESDHPLLHGVVLEKRCIMYIIWKKPCIEGRSE